MIMDGLTDPVLQYIRDQLLLQGRLIYGFFFKLRPGGWGLHLFSAHFKPTMTRKHNRKSQL